MPEQINKFTPDRDLQAYFLTPSAIAALSSASSSGFTLSGKWRQQFDWAVVEWNRDNVFEHPSLRNLPDGDLSSIVLSYDEERVNCIPVQSNLFPTVDWNELRLWVPQADGSDIVYFVDIAGLAVPVGSAQPASASMTLINAPVGNRVGLAFLEEHYYYDVTTSDVTAAAAGLAAAINSFSSRFTATSSGGPTVTVTWNAAIANPNLNGANGNRLTVYGFTDASGIVWSSPSATFSGGAFPAKYHLSFDFANLSGYFIASDNSHVAVTNIPTNNVRKVRWTWAADIQPAQYVQQEFSVTLSNWTISGNGLYKFPGPGSRRIEDSDSSVTYSGLWNVETGNYSGSKAHFTREPGFNCTISYREAATHQLYLGVRRTPQAPTILVVIDGQPALQLPLALSGEDILVRYPLGSVAAGSHTVTISNNAGSGSFTFYFDFLEIVYPTDVLPDFPPQSQLSLATDWDTYHSQSLPAERTAWLINQLGFNGRVNHYVGALWFYEIVRSGTQYASLTVDLQLTPSQTSPYIQFALAGTAADLTNPATQTLVSHLVLPDDTSATVAIAFAALINLGTNLVWANATGTSLTVTARQIGEAGNGIGFQLWSQSPYFTVTAPSNALGGGVDGEPYDPLPLNDPDSDNYATLQSTAQFWRTDLTALPRINRAARDWHLAYFKALRGYGLDAVAAFSTELMNGDPSTTVGIAQRYVDGTPTVVTTPAIQTNFSSTSLAFWKQVYLDMAQLQANAGLLPYLQSGEVQWWYFQKPAIGMPFYDEFTKQQFTAKFGTTMQTILANDSDPTQFPNEMEFLPALIGAYTAAIRSTLQSQFPGCRYEVLYPTDTNNYPINRIVNYASSDWTPPNLNCLKTESFGFTGSYDLVNCTMSMSTSAAKGFPNPQRSHLVGIGDAWSAWLKEVDIAQSQGLESVVLFALDQYCLIGYPPPPFVKTINSLRQG